MITIWIPTSVIASFWLTVFVTNYGPGKQEAPGRHSQPEISQNPSNLPLCWDRECGSGFVFKTISEEHAQIQIVLGWGHFGSNEGQGVQEKLQEFEASNINARNI